MRVCYTIGMDTAKYKKRLEAEKTKLVNELKTVGRINPDNPRDWEPVPGGNSGTLKADRNEAADKIEQFEENSAILKELETRYNNVLLALKKIEDGTFGICEISGKRIEEDRLEANPAARTCKKHLGELEE